MSELASGAIDTYKVSDKSGLYSWATTRDKLKDRIKLHKTKTKDGIIIDQLREFLEGDTRLICISIADPCTIKQLAIELTRNFLQ